MPSTAEITSALLEHPCPACDQPAGQPCVGRPDAPLEPHELAHVERIGRALGDLTRDRDQARAVASDRLREATNPWEPELRALALELEQRARQIRSASARIPVARPRRDARRRGR